LAVENKLLALASEALMFSFRMGVVSIVAFQVCLELLPNFHGENPTTFHLIFVEEIRQRFTPDAL